MMKMKFNQKKISIILVSVLATAGCVPAGKKFAVEFKDPSVFSNLKLDVSSVQVQNNQLIVRGSGLKDIKAIKLINNGVTESLVVESASSGQLVANGLSAVAIGVGKVFDMVLADAYGSATVPVTFTLENGSITAAHLNNMGAVSGQVLKYNGVVWEPSTLSSSQIYQGVWDADTNTPNLNLTSPVSGEYYIVSVAGTYNSVSYDVGDWIIHNGTSWDKVISSAANKLSLSGGTLTGNLQLDTLLKFKGASNYVTLKASSSLASDITLVLPKTVGTSGQFLTTDGTGVMSWTTPADPVIANLNASQIADGSVSNTAFQYLAGATSNIQAQLNAKQATGNFVTALTGDVTASGAGSVAATVVQVGGVSAANIATGVALANAATDANTAGAIIRRDSSGNFSAGTITGTFNGNATNVTGTVAVANGGTGNTTLGVNQLLFGNGTSAINGLATTGIPSVLLSNVASGAPTWTTTTPGNVLKGSVSGVVFGTLASSDLPAGTLSGSGTANYIPYYSTASTLANSPMAISGSNVGIGTTTPSSLLDVGGTLSLNDGTTKVHSIIPNISVNGTARTLRFSDSSTVANEGYQFYNSNTSTSLMMIQQNGNVGIGTTAPVSKLNIQDASGNSPIQLTTSGGLIGDSLYMTANGRSRFGYDGTRLAVSIGDYSPLGTSAGKPIVLDTGGSERVRIDTSGNVGIGTASPSSLLHLASASPYITYEETDTTQKFFSGVDGSRYWIRQGSTGNPDLLTLLSNGNFGIGATSPSQLLSVGSNQFTVSSSGAVAATSVSVPSFSSLTLSSSLTNSSFILPSSSNGSVLAYSPASKVMWHDRLAFSKAFGAPTFEVFNGSWSAGTLDAGLFSKQENRAIQQIDGVTSTAARWTWNHSSISYSSIEWWAMGFTYTATASAKNILIESSADGVTWTSRHTSTGNMANQSVVLFNMSTNGSETYLRLTITVTNGQPLVMSSIRALSARWGNQGGGSEQEYPYVWDSAQRIAFGSNASAANGVVTVGTSTTAASGGIYFGPDTNLYRLGANSLRTDGAFSMGGNVGIGTTSPSYKLHVVGAGGATVGYFSDGTATCSITPATAGNISCSSDERLKKSVKAFSDSLSLESVLKLKTVTYEWKNINNGRHTGYIAQELEKIAPEFVTTGKDGFKQVSYTGLIPWITGAIKAFYGEFKALTTRVMSLEEKDKAKDRVIASVKAESVQLKKDNELLKLENKAIKSYLCSRDPKAGICK